MVTPNPPGCQGPLIWRDVSTDPADGAVLECAAPGCGYFIATGWIHDQAHAHTDMLREGLATP